MATVSIDYDRLWLAVGEAVEGGESGRIMEGLKLSLKYASFDKGSVLLDVEEMDLLEIYFNFEEEGN